MPWKGLRSNTAGGRKSKNNVRETDVSQPSTPVERDGGTKRPQSNPVMEDPTTALPPCPSPSHNNVDQSVQDDKSTLQEPTTLYQRRTGLMAPRSNRFSLLRSRHASDPQLSKSYAAASPLPPQALSARTPTIITTAPSASSFVKNPRLKDRLKLATRSQNPSSEHVAVHRQFEASQSSLGLSVGGRDSSTPNVHVSFEEPNRLTALPLLRSSSPVRGLPPAYGDFPTPSLSLPPARLSESSRSDASSSSPRIYAETTTTHTVSTTTTFFRLPRRRKEKGHLFPLPVQIPPPDQSRDPLRTPTSAQPGRGSMSPLRGSRQLRDGINSLYVPERRPDSASGNTAVPSPTQSTSALSHPPLTSSSLSLFRRNSIASHHSAKSTPSVPLAPSRLNPRDRASTVSSEKKAHDPMSPQFGPSSRTSTSTSGRKSLGDLFSLSSKFRQNSEPTYGLKGRTPGTPASIGSKQNSFQIPREPVLDYPERAEGDSPASYMEKLEEAVTRGVIAAIICKGADEFSQTCLRKYMRGFSYFGDSIDMSVRKMLMEVELPKETQQIDRLLSGFAGRYCECNPGIFVSAEEAYIVAFSILLLHSDTHNKNNKRKMQKQDYIKNTQGQVEVSGDILECFYDNICYTPFIHFEDEVAVNTHRLTAPKKKGLFKAPSTDNLRGPVDPYALILDQKLEVLRPSLKDVMDTEDMYNCTGTALMDADALYQAFYKASVLQIVSARSRPDAFLSQATISNPAEAQVGLVDIKAAKVGLVWRKDPRKKKTRSPWQEWGALLTGSQLYFFRDVAWVKGLMSQYEGRQRLGLNPPPVTFKPPLTNFKPEAFLSMDDAVALLDTSYKKHKHAFLFIKHGGFEETFLANNETDMNDWIAKLNYAATFRTSAIRMRGLLGANYEGQRPLLDRHGSSKSSLGSADEKAIDGGQINETLAGEILAYRKQLMIKKIHEANERLGQIQKELENLLRNARHLQTCSPIQQKTREALVLAAGRMSAKLKWTRVEMWKTKCHRDILKMDLEQEIGKTSVATILREPSSSKSVSHKQASLKTGDKSAREARPDDAPTSPKSVQSKTSTTVAPQKERSKVVDTARETLDVSLAARPPSVIESVDGSTADLLKEMKEKPRSVSMRSHNGTPLNHRGSMGSSRLARSDADSIGHGSRLTAATPTMDDEERVLREAGILEADQTPKGSRRPGTSDSNRDFPSVTSDAVLKERPAVRRSLQRTLRDSDGLRSQHSLRHRKARESLVQPSPSSTRRSSQSRNEGLARSTGSFTVHGKKASVVTFGSEWQSMSGDERSRLRMQSLGNDNEASDDGHVVTILSPKAEEDEEEDEAVEGKGPSRTKESDIDEPKTDDEDVGDTDRTRDGSETASPNRSQEALEVGLIAADTAQSSSSSEKPVSENQLGDHLSVTAPELRRSPSPQVV